MGLPKKGYNKKIIRNSVPNLISAREFWNLGSIHRFTALAAEIPKICIQITIQKFDYIQYIMASLFCVSFFPNFSSFSYWPIFCNF